jgi:hypothetical protein
VSGPSWISRPRLKSYLPGAAACDDWYVYLRLRILGALENVSALEHAVVNMNGRR